MTKKIFLLWLLAINISCNSSKNTVQENNCDQTDIMCTEQFISVTVQIFDINNIAIELDNFKIIRKDTGEDISNKNALDQNYYSIIDDSYQSKLANKELTLTFKGYLDNVEVITEEYVVSADCCHIYLVSGKTKITL